jgi:CubicO group peptidase (beta-lactamase class C family)
MGYATLGLIIEKVSGEEFSVFMREEVFGFLGMNNSYWFLRDIPHNNIACPHVLPGKKSTSNEVKILPHYGYPDFLDGQLRTTTGEY